MRCSWCLTWLFFVPKLFGAHGTLETLDGKRFQGQIRIAESGFVVANAAQEYVIEISLTNLGRILFVDRPSRPIEFPPLAQTSSDVLPATWQRKDIGRVPTAGSANYHGGLLTMRCSASGIGGRSDSLNLVYQPMQGDCDLIGRVIAMQPREAMTVGTNEYHRYSTARVGLMIRQNLTANARNVMVGLGGDGRGVAQRREEEGDIPRSMTDPTMRLWQWLRLKRRDNVVSVYKSGNGRIWWLVETLELPLGDQVYVGFALASSAESKPASATIDHIRIGEFLVDESIVPRVEVQSGSVIVGQIDSIDDRLIRFTDHPGLQSLSASSVSRVLFRWLTPKLADKIASYRPGILLVNGDFVEGDFKGIRKGRVKISSVLFGLREFELDEATAIILRRPVAKETTYRVALQNKSLLRAESIAPGNGDLLIRDAALGEIRVPTEELSEIRRTAGRAGGLAISGRTEEALGFHQVSSIASP